MLYSYIIHIYHVLRTKDSTISDADIDIILEQGKKRTEEIKNLTKREQGNI
jgi:hypothetical protein